MRILFLILSCCAVWSLPGAENRIWMSATINGQPVRLVLDTGATQSALFRPAAERLKLKIIQPPADVKDKPGEYITPYTEPADFVSGNFSAKVQFHVLDVSFYPLYEGDGVQSWYPFKNKVFVMDLEKMMLDVRDVVPPAALAWPKFPQTDTQILGFTTGGSDPQHDCVYIDTGAEDGVALCHALWEKWTAAHTNQPSTMLAYSGAGGDIFVTRQMWASELQIGSLLLHDVPVHEMDKITENNIHMPHPAAILELFALFRLDFVLDGTNQMVYMQPKKGIPPNYVHNKLGASFVPANFQSDPLLAHVAPGSPADRAGIRDGDQLLKLDDLDVTHWRTDKSVLAKIHHVISEGAPGTVCQLTLKRGEKEFQTKATIQRILYPAGLSNIAPVTDEELRAKAEKGDAEAQYNLGIVYLYGHLGIAKDEAKAVKLFRQAAEQNHAAAQNALGSCYEKGLSVAVNAEEAVKWFRKSAEQNYAEAQANLGRACATGLGVAKNSVEAVKWFRQGAAQDNATAQNFLGVCYLKGDGVTKDEKEAVNWYRKAAAQYNSSAQNNLGGCYMRGDGVAVDKEEAIKLFRMAAAQNDSEALYNLGIVYFNGIGVTNDAKEGMKWFRQAALLNHPNAQYNLGTALVRGIGVDKNEVEGAKWLTQAALQNIAEAQSNLGLCYANGVGVAKDELEAYKWALVASAQGEASSINLAKMLVDQLTPKQIAEAQKRARDFQAGGAQAH